MEMTYETVIKIIESAKTLEEYTGADYSNIISQALISLRELPVEPMSIGDIVEDCLCGFSINSYMSNGIWYADIYDDVADIFDDETDECIAEGLTNPIDIINSLNIYWDDQFTDYVAENIREYDEDAVYKHTDWDSLLSYFKSTESNKVIIENPEYFIHQFKILQNLCNPNIIKMYE